MFATHLECSYTGERYDANTVQGLSRAGRPLLVRYDLDKVGQSLDRDALAKRTEGLWRYRELLPVRERANEVSLGEVVTPLINLPSFAAKQGSTGQLVVKDEGRLPTGSFKARGLCLAVSMAKELGLSRLAMPTNGNAGAAMAAYAARAGLETVVLCPDDTPMINVAETELQGATVYLVNGLINECGKIVGDGKDIAGWFDCSTLKEPYRIEGKKTMGLELAEQMNWSLPDIIFYPTGGGTGLIGMWKAFAELKALGWIDGPLPKMVAVQAEGCAPIVKAFEENTRHAELWQDAHTVAAGIRVPVAVGDFLILDAVRESGGFALAVSDDDIVDAQHRVAREEGLLLCPEGAATIAAWEAAKAKGLIDGSEHAVAFNCATGLKYPMPEVTRSLDKNGPIDFASM